MMTGRKECADCGTVNPKTNANRRRWKSRRKGGSAFGRLEWLCADGESCRARIAREQAPREGLDPMLPGPLLG